MSVHSVTTGAELKSALEDTGPGGVVQPGDAVELVGSGNFTMTTGAVVPSKAVNKPIIIQPAGYEPGTGNWPAHGSRLVDPTGLPVIQAAELNKAAIYGPVSGPGNYVMRGMTIRATAAADACIIAGPYQIESTPIRKHEQLPSWKFQHVYIDGDYKAQDGILSTGSGLIVLDSSIIKAYDATAGESHAIAAYGSTGPVLIQNNYITSVTCGIFFGGAASDIAPQPNFEPFGTIRCNHIEGDLASGHTTAFKNLLEFKLGCEWLIEGNVFDTAWVAAQTHAVTHNQNATSVAGRALQRNSHFTYRRNVFKNMPNWFSTGTGGAALPDDVNQYATFLLEDNLCWLGYDPKADSFTSPGYYGVLTISGSRDVTLRRNSMFAGNDGSGTIANNTVFLLAVSATHPLTNLTLDDNLVALVRSGTYAVMYTRTPSFDAGKALAFDPASNSTGLVRNNVLFRGSTHASYINEDVGATTGDNPNVVVAAADVATALSTHIDFADNGRIKAGSAWLTASTTAGPVGADLDLVEAWTTGVETGTPSILPSAGL